MKTCPKCAYVRQPHETHVNAGICPACGIAYQKWLERQDAVPPAGPVKNEGRANRGAVPGAVSDPDSALEPVTLWERARYLFLSAPVRVDPEAFWGRAAVWLALLLWAVYFTMHGVDWEIIGSSFLHNINLAFHEFGHVFFSPFGDFMMILGGSLFQVLLPLGLLLAFSYYQADNFGASTMLWWCGQSLVDVSPYIRDAEYRTLPLVGSGTEESHDWGNLLTMLDSVDNCYALAHSSFALGVLVMVTGLAWGAHQLWLQYQVMTELDDSQDE